MGGNPLETMGVNPIFLLSQIVNFLILFVALSVFLWKPLMKRLDERRETLEKEQKDAAALAEERADIEAERQRVLDEARAEVQKILAEAREQAGGVVERAKQDGRRQADKVLAEARQAGQEERNRILADMRSQVASLAIAAAQKVVGETLDEKRQQALVDSFFSGVREGRIAVLPEGELGAAGAPVVVTSAMPLSKKERDAIQKDLAARMGGGSPVSFQVDPQILGGLTVRVGDRLVDGSAAGQLERLQQTLA